MSRRARRRSPSSFTACTASTAFAVMLLASPAAADGGAIPDTDRAFQIRLGGFFPRGGDGDVWDANEALFTLDRSDFDSVAVGLSYVSSLSNHLELGVNLDFQGETVLSEQRDPIAGGLFTDTDGFTVRHDTQLGLVPLTLDLRLLPGGRFRLRPGGRHVLQPAVYVGGGIGATFWEYEEIGDFVDDPIVPTIISFDRFRDTGVAFEAHLLAGVDFPISRSVNLLVEGRYAWADDELGESYARSVPPEPTLPDLFLGADELDLGGVAVHGGVAFRF